MWSYSVLKFISPLHIVTSVVYHERMCGKMYRSGWMYFRRSRLVRGGALTFTGNLGVYGVVFWYALFDASCGLSYPEYDVSTDASS